MIKKLYEDEKIEKYAIEFSKYEFQKIIGFNTSSERLTGWVMSKTEVEGNGYGWSRLIITFLVYYYIGAIISAFLNPLAFWILFLGLYFYTRVKNESLHKKLFDPINRILNKRNDRSSEELNHEDNYLIEIKDLLFRIIYENGLFLTEKGFVKYSPACVIEINKHEKKLLSVSIERLNDVNLGKKIEKLELPISSAFGEVLTFNSTASTVQYILKPNVEILDLNAALENSRINENIYLNGIYDWNFNKNPHGLVVGATGSGKTMMLNYLIKNLMENFNAIVYLADTKMVDFHYFLDLEENVRKGLKYHWDEALGFDDFQIYGKDSASIFKVLRQVEHELKVRQEYLIKYKMRNYKEAKGEIPPLFWFFDEYTSVINCFTDKKMSAEFEKRLRDLMSRARAFGIYIVFGMQRAQADILDSFLREQVNFKMVLGSNNNDSYRMVFGTTDVEYQSKTVGTGYYLLSGMVRPLGFDGIDLTDLNANSFNDLINDENISFRYCKYMYLN